MAADNYYIEDQSVDDFNLLMDRLEFAKQHPPLVAQTKKQVIYQENKLHLYRYDALDVNQNKTPILIVYALVNRPFITDLEPDRSLVLRLLEQGYPVYLIDWGYPDNSDSLTSLDDYINRYLFRCVKQLQRDAGVKKIDMLGVCQGGVFSLCYSALHPEHIRSLITLVTPVNFHTHEDPLRLWACSSEEKYGSNIPASRMAEIFKTIKPYQTTRDKYRHLAKIVNDRKRFDTFLRMEKWLTSGPDLAAKAADEFTQKFYQLNQLYQGKLTIGQHPIKLKNISCPVLNLFSKKDSLIPMASSQALSQIIRKNLYQEKALSGGHIGAFVSPKAQQLLLKTMTKWLEQRD